MDRYPKHVSYKIQTVTPGNNVEHSCGNQYKYGVLDHDNHAYAWGIAQSSDIGDEDSSLPVFDAMFSTRLVKRVSVGFLLDFTEWVAYRRNLEYRHTDLLGNVVLAAEDLQVDGLNLLVISLEYFTVSVIVLELFEGA